MAVTINILQEIIKILHKKMLKANIYINPTAMHQRKITYNLATYTSCQRCCDLTSNLQLWIVSLNRRVL